jgi:hypothetical protein
VIALALYARFLILVIAAQFYAAGLAIFGATTFVPHAIIGWTFIVLALVLVVAAMVSRSRRVVGWPAVGVLLLAISQPVIVFGLRQWPPVAAVHPVIGVVIAGLLLVISRRAKDRT